MRRTGIRSRFCIVVFICIVFTVHLFSDSPTPGQKLAESDEILKKLCAEALTSEEGHKKYIENHEKEGYTCEKHVKIIEAAENRQKETRQRNRQAADQRKKKQEQEIESFCSSYLKTGKKDIFAIAAHIEDEKFEKCENHETIKSYLCGQFRNNIKELSYNELNRYYPSTIRVCGETIYSEFEERKNNVNEFCEEIERFETTGDLSTGYLSIYLNDEKFSKCPESGIKKQKFCNNFHNKIKDFSQNDLLTKDNKDFANNHCDEQTKKHFFDTKTKVNEFCSQFETAKTLDASAINDLDRRKCDNYEHLEEEWNGRKEKCDEIYKNFVFWNLDELKNASADIKFCKEEYQVSFKKRFKETKDFCLKVDNIKDVEEYEKLKGNNLFNKCPEETQKQDEIWGKCLSIKKEMEEKTIDDLNNLLENEETPDQCHEIIEKRISCVEKVEEFKQSLSKLVRFDKSEYDKALNKTKSCESSWKDIGVLAEESGKFFKRYSKNYIQSEPDSQWRAIDVEKLVIPEYKNPKKCFGKIRHATPNSYLKIVCDGCIDETAIKQINRKLRSQAQRNKEIVDDQNTKTIRLEWNPYLKYVLKLMDKNIFKRDTLLAEIPLNTNQICGYKNFNIEESLPSEELDGNIEIKIRQRKTRKEDMDCPWDE